jgi:hypothetical protein
MVAMAAHRFKEVIIPVSQKIKVRALRHRQGLPVTPPLTVAAPNRSRAAQNFVPAMHPRVGCVQPTTLGHGTSNA